MKARGSLAVQPIGALVRPHLHTREDEYSIVTEGEIGFGSGDREVVLGPGGYISRPRGELHAMWNAGAVPARMIEIISPAGFERFFYQLAELVADGPPRPDQVMSLAAAHGLQFGTPEWLPDVIARYNLAPPTELRSPTKPPTQGHEAVPQVPRSLVESARTDS
jgi:uncharacterized cupin superfamily protein